MVILLSQPASHDPPDRGEVQAADHLISAFSLLTWTVRKPRSDAQRNRERILEVAKQVFTRRGADASMDEIAKRAKRSVPLSGAAKSFDASLRYRLEVAIVSSG
jgi:hypothetical protein